MGLSPHIVPSRPAPLRNKLEVEDVANDPEPYVLRRPMIQATQSLLFDSVLFSASSFSDNLTLLVSNTDKPPATLLGNEGQMLGQLTREAYNVEVLPEEDQEIDLYLAYAKGLFDEVAQYCGDLSAKEKRFKSQCESLINGGRLWHVDEKRKKKLEEEKAAKTELRLLERRPSGRIEHKAKPPPALRQMPPRRHAAAANKHAAPPPPPPPPPRPQPAQQPPPPPPSTTHLDVKPAPPTAPITTPTSRTSTHTKKRKASGPSSKKSSSAHVKGAKYSKEVTDILVDWFLRNRHEPYPTPEVLEDLSEKTNLTVEQTRNWLTNIRKRHLKPVMANKRRPRTFFDYVLIAAFRKKSAAKHHGGSGSGSGSGGGGVSKASYRRPGGNGGGKALRLSPLVSKYRIVSQMEEGGGSSYSPCIRLAAIVEQERRQALPRQSKSREVSYREKNSSGEDEELEDDGDDDEGSVYHTEDDMDDSDEESSEAKARAKKARTKGPATSSLGHKGQSSSSSSSKKRKKVEPPASMPLKKARKNQE